MRSMVAGKSRNQKKSKEDSMTKDNMWTHAEVRPEENQKVIVLLSPRGALEGTYRNGIVYRDTDIYSDSTRVEWEDVLMWARTPRSQDRDEKIGGLIKDVFGGVWKNVRGGEYESGTLRIHVFSSMIRLYYEEGDVSLKAHESGNRGGGEFENDGPFGAVHQGLINLKEKVDKFLKLGPVVGVDS